MCAYLWAHSLTHFSLDCPPREWEAVSDDSGLITGKERGKGRVTRKFEDVVENEVRRRYADLLASAGVDSGRLSLEVLYLLPEEFVREYVELFWEALREDIPSAGGGDNVIKKAGEVKRNKKVRTGERDEQGRVREVAVPGSNRGAQGGGKKYKTHWLIKSEVALEVKRRVDRKLVRIIGSTRGEVHAAMTDSKPRARSERGADGKFRRGK